MADISTEISQIRQAVYGEQVRGSIVSALTKLNEQGQQKDWQDEIDKKQDKLSNLGGTTGQYIGFLGNGEVSAQNIIQREIMNLPETLDGKQAALTDGVTVKLGDTFSGYVPLTKDSTGVSLTFTGKYYLNQEKATEMVWIDGSPIKRVVIKLESQTYGGHKYGLPGTVTTLIRMYGCVIPSSSVIDPFPNLPGDINYVITGEITDSGKNLNVFCGSGTQIQSGYVILEYV